MHHQPPGAHTVNAYITVDDPGAALEFYTRAFGAETTLTLPMGDTIAHAEFRIGDTGVMLSGEWPERGVLGPKSRGGPSGMLVIYVPDADAAYARALAAGASSESAPSNEFYGDRAATVVDPFGHHWGLHTHQEEVSEAEMRARMARWTETMAEGQPS